MPLPGSASTFTQSAAPRRRDNPSVGRDAEGALVDDFVANPYANVGLRHAPATRFPDSGEIAPL